MGRPGQDERDNLLNTWLLGKCSPMEQAYPASGAVASAHQQFTVPAVCTGAKLGAILVLVNAYLGIKNGRIFNMPVVAARSVRYAHRLLKSVLAVELFGREI